MACARSCWVAVLVAAVVGSAAAICRDAPLSGYNLRGKAASCTDVKEACTDEVVGPVLHKVCPVTCGVCELAAADMFDEDIYLGLVDAFEDAQTEEEKKEIGVLLHARHTMVKKAAVSVATDAAETYDFAIAKGAYETALVLGNAIKSIENMFPQGSPPPGNPGGGSGGGGYDGGMPPDYPPLGDDMPGEHHGHLDGGNTDHEGPPPDGEWNSEPDGDDQGPLGSESEDNIESGWMQLNFDAKLVSGEIVALPRPDDKDGSYCLTGSGATGDVQFGSAQRAGFPTTDYQRALLAKLPPMAPSFGVDWVPASITAEDIHDKYISQSRPFIIGKGIIDHWPAMHKWTAEGFSTYYAGITVNVSRSPKPQFDVAHYLMDDFGREFADFAFARIGFDAGGDSGWVEEDIVPEWLGVAWPRDGIKGIQLVMEMSNDAKTRGTYNEEAIRGNIALSTGGDIAAQADQVAKAGGIGILVINTTAHTTTVRTTLGNSTDKTFPIHVGYLQKNQSSTDRLLGLIEASAGRAIKVKVNYQLRRVSMDQTRPLNLDAGAHGGDKAAAEAKKEEKFVAKVRTGHRYEDFQPVTVSLKQYVEEVMLGSDGTEADPDVRYIFNTMGNHLQYGCPTHPMRGDFDPPAAIQQAANKALYDAAHVNGSFEFFFGPTLTGAHIHGHPGAWNGLVSGRKRWVITPPHKFNQVAELYQQKGITAYQWFQDALPKIREIYPKHVWEFIQEEGEVVYIPPAWGHAILNLEPSVGVSLQIGKRRAVDPPQSVRDLWSTTHIPGLPVPADAPASQ